MGVQLIADGPTRYLGGSIITYLRPAHQASVGTRDPGISGVISVRGPVPAGAARPARSTIPGGQPPNAMATEGEPDHPSAAEGEK
ncbi:MAG TPA: hypothetical protein VGG16_19635 [Streptosporangiaceae bacterium]|jgi:hypothetical protein